VVVVPPGGGRRLRGEVIAVSREDDLAVVEVRGATLPAVSVQGPVSLGQEVWVVGFPWGRRLTLVSGVVSQLALDEESLAIEGPARMVDASVSYGVSGGGVFDVTTGALVALVEGYRTARVTLRNTTEPAFDMPVAGETTVVPGPVILRFLEAQGIGLPRGTE
jgi:S1-C subfamily serine protease